jgi:hypothetical protein
MHRILGFFAVATVALTACGGQSGSPAALSGPQVVKTLEAGSISSEWVQWDKKSCSHLPATDHPATWNAVLRKPSKPFKVAHGNNTETGQMGIDIGNMFKEAARLAGIQLIYANYNWPSTTDPVPVAQSIAVKKPDVVVSYQVLGPVDDAVNNRYNSICAPVIKGTVPYKNYPTFGPNDAGQRQADG